MDYSCADLNGLINVADMRDVPREDIFKLCVSIDATNFLIFVSELVLKVMFIFYIPYLSPWFSADCATIIAHSNHFFCLYKQLIFSI